MTKDTKRQHTGVKISTLFNYDRLDRHSKRIVQQSRNLYKKQINLYFKFEELNGKEYQDDFWDMTFELKPIDPINDSWSD